MNLFRPIWSRTGLLALLVFGWMNWAFAPCKAAGNDLASPYLVPVLVVSFFPTNGSNIDIAQTGDWGQSLAATRQKTQRQTTEVIKALQEGSRYRAFLNFNAVPCLRYSVVGSLEFLSPLPTFPKAGHQVPMTDYRRIMELVNIENWVQNKGVKEVWIWAYHGGKVDLWESNMASRFGDVSNSDRDPSDLPVLSKTPCAFS